MYQWSTTRIGDVRTCYRQEIRIVVKHSDADVASCAENAADTFTAGVFTWAARMVMVDMPVIFTRLSCAANSTAITLRCEDVVKLVLRQAVLLFQVSYTFCFAYFLPIRFAITLLVKPKVFTLASRILSNATLTFRLLPVRRALHVVKLAAGLNLAATVTPFVHYLLDLAGSGRVTAFGGAGASSTGSGV